MILEDLLDVLPTYECRGDSEVEISDISYHTASVTQGALFVALPGFKVDGREFIPQAVAQGAVAVMFEGEFFDNLRVPQIRVSGVRAALGVVSSWFEGDPSRELYCAGITGTNGKTTLTYLLEAIWREAGLNAGVMGTINIRYPGFTKTSETTTPESRDIQGYLAAMRKNNVSHVALEVSSHALELDRVRGCDFDAAIFTNLTQDHLDFHEGIEDYYRAKEALFTNYLPSSAKPDKVAVIHGDNPWGKRLERSLRKAGVAVVSYGLSEANDLKPASYELGFSGMTARLKWGPKTWEVSSPLIGEFNLLNVMAALALSVHMGLDEAKVLQAIAACRGAPGRLEQIDGLGFQVFVDYAHTPDAIKNVLQALRNLKPKRLITVFGCGGDRDKTKRPLMGWEAATLSDICLVTSDNPRTEAPETIIGDILPGVHKAGLAEFKGDRGYQVEVDRKKAITRALDLAGSGDVVLIAGKGHEDYQIIGTTKRHFSDQEVVREILNQCK